MLVKCCYIIVLSLFIQISWADEKIDFLWSDGPKNRCFRHVQQNDNVRDIETEFLQNDDCPYFFKRLPTPSCAGFKNNGYCPLWNVITYGWDISEKDRYPGWALWNVSGGWGSPLEIALINNARTASNPCKLREVSFSWEWPDLSLRRTDEGNVVTLGDLKALEVTFQGKISNVASPACVTNATQFVSEDIVLQFPNGVAYSIGVLVYNHNDLDLNGNSKDDIFYTNYDKKTPEICIQGMKCQTLIHGKSIGLNARYLSGEYQLNTIEFVGLFTSGKYLPMPPSPYKWSDAIISHIQVVNHTRGGNIRVDLKDQHVNVVSNSSIQSIKCYEKTCFLSGVN